MSDTNILVADLVDINYRGLQYNEAESQQYPFRLSGTEAVKNVIKMYLMSEWGDYGRDLTIGGPLFKTIGKLMNDNSQLTIERDIRSALSKYSNIVVSTVTVTRMNEDRKWKIGILFSDTYNKFTDSINLVITEG
jgi:hypothetical protein